MATVQPFFDTIGNMATTETPGARFRTFRTHAGLTGQALAEQLGVTKTAVSYWESGRVSLSRTACLLAEHLYRISSAWLLAGTGPMWRTGPPADLSSEHNLVLRPLLSDDAFQADGTLVPPGDLAPCLGLPLEVIQKLLKRLGEGAASELFFVLAHGHELEPTIHSGDWVLIHTGEAPRRMVDPHALYLVRICPEDRSVLRRVAVDPASGDFLISADQPGQVPLRTTVAMERRLAVLLGKVCWVGGIR